MSGLVQAADSDLTDLLSQAEKHYQQGQYFLALDALRSAQKSASSDEQNAKINGLYGQTHYQMRHYVAAEEFLRQAIDSNAGSASDRARWLVTLANIQNSRDQTDAARQQYQQALTIAGGNPELVIGIRLGLASLLPTEQRLAELTAINPTLDGIADPIIRSRYLLQLGAQAQRLGSPGLKLAYDSFQQARQNLGDQQPRLQAESLDGLAQLYEDQNRQEEAMRLNTQAIQLAQGIEAHDLLINLEWRQGRLYRFKQQLPEATVYYQNAIDEIEEIRHDIPVEYHNGRSSFREVLEPVYLGLADVLLAQAAKLSEDQKSPLLRRARDAVELIKKSELEDFLGGRCAVQSYKNVLLDNVESTTAIIYPIILPDRLELLISSGSEIKQFTQAVPADGIENQIQQLAHRLRNAQKDAKILSKQLYDWLIAPAEPWLREQGIQTLVMLPDGALRMIPVAALYDGERYLVERYAIATSPGLSIIESTASLNHSQKALLVGLSEPGPVISHLPPAFMEALVAASERGVDLAKKPFSRALPVGLNSKPDKSREVDIARLVTDADFQRNMKQALSLPGVSEEINTLRREMPNTVLMNQDFTVEGFNQQVLQEPYSMVHIASHAVFGNSADTTFLMAYDNVINIDDLERLLKSDKFVKQPVELLTLSACQTAEGDDRAPLGISGIALKAKVRSALGSLWPVSDEAASQLMAEFYKALAVSGTSKAQALRQAQISLIKQDRLENPFYWSPFILVGNWL
ncbi:CHAT domain-containing protein [Methylomonas sp. MO1]|uniref:CHAT domain-containing protein n=1 Tax=unclassified Methylomonas TaxID=2608980 RepID=UPI0018CC683A|nr:MULTISPECIES: CHAT domain-containing protein [unclassified Methylomonas]MDT4291944.1 CHAT domain-containing protein [Methylomonas sp. MO1]